MEQQINPAAEHSSYFTAFIQSLVTKFQPLQIICFSKTSKLVQTQGCFRQTEAAMHCNYCLLMVINQTQRIDHEVQDYANAHYRQGNITIVCHSNEAIQQALANHKPFFSSVYQYGKVIYSHDGMLNLDVQPIYGPGADTADLQHQFQHRMQLAEGFMIGAAECLAKERYNSCVFMLHQVVEQSCAALIRMHLHYRADFHNLRRLLNLCTAFSDQPYKLFLSTQEDERLFDVLVKSYSEARYKDNFIVAGSDAEILYHKVISFVELTKTISNDLPMAYKSAAPPLI